MSSEKNNKNLKTATRRARPGRGPGPHGGGVPVEKAKNFKESFRRLVGYLGRKKGALITVIIMAAGSAAFSIIGPKLLGNATTEIFKGLMAKLSGVPGAGINFDEIVRLLTIVISLYVISALLSYLQQFIMAGVSQRLVYGMRNEVKAKLSKLPLKYFDSRTHGEILSRVTNDIDTISNTLQQSVTQVITAVTTIIGVTIMMLTISGWMTLVTIFVLPLVMFIAQFVIKRSQKYFKGQQKEIGNVNGHVEEMYAGHNIIKAFSKEKKSIDQFDEINERLYTVGWKAQFMSSIMMPLMNVVNNLSYVIVCVVGGIMVINGRIQIGDVQAFIQYSRSFTQPISQTAQIANVMQSAVAAAERVFEVLDETEMVKDPAKPKVLKAQGAVDFEHVSFGYDKDVTIIKDMNLKVNPGEVIAIVGPTGAGKTTLVNLLMRFYDVNSGEIRVDGMETRGITRENLRDAFGMVLQDTWLFNGTIRDNISYGKKDATEMEVIRAAKIAHADHFIRTLPDGYDTVLNEDATNISQGQRQLITIARALLADPKILILDEATSSVDTRTEQYIQNGMIELMRGRTSFVIAHRLSTIRDANTILVMNEGEVIEQGNHKELMDQNGFYADLYNSQFTGADLTGRPA